MCRPSYKSRGSCCYRCSSSPLWQAVMTQLCYFLDLNATCKLNIGGKSIHVRWFSAQWACKQSTLTFLTRFPSVTFSRKQNIHTVVNRWRQTGFLLEKDRTKSTCRLLTEEKFHEIGFRREHFSQQSFRRLEKDRASKSSVLTATKLLNW
jgi:hypothetical protein